MKIAIPVELESIREASLGHLEHRVLDSPELVLHLWIILGRIIQGAQDLERLRFSALQREPSWRFRQTRNQEADEERQEDLESDGETPGDGRWIQEREAEINPVRQHDAKDDERAFDHDHLASTVGF